MAGPTLYSSGGAGLALQHPMLLEGICTDGHEIVCVLQGGRLSGVLSAGKLRKSCPVCGGEPYLALESGTVAVGTRIPPLSPPLIVPRRHG